MSDLGDLVRTLVATTANKKKLQVSLKELTAQEKALKKAVQDAMKGQELDVVNSKSGEKITRSTRKSKGGLTKDVIKRALMERLDDDEDDVTRVMTRMEDLRTKTEKEILSVRAPKAAAQST